MTAQATKNLKAVIAPVRNMFGKLNGSYAAQLVHADAVLIADEGNTREQAQGNLAQKIADMERHSHTRLYRWAKDGTLFALYYAHGWAYDIVKRDGGTSSCFMSTRSQSEALATMERHAEQYGS